MGGKSDPCSKKTWILNVKLQVYVSPVHPLLMLLRTFGSLAITLPSEIILKMGEPGNSLDRNYHYSVEKDINFIAEKSNNRNVRFVSLF